MKEKNRESRRQLHHASLTETKRQGDAAAHIHMLPVVLTTQRALRVCAHTHTVGATSSAGRDSLSCMCLSTKELVTGPLLLLFSQFLHSDVSSVVQTYV